MRSARSPRSSASRVSGSRGRSGSAPRPMRSRVSSRRASRHDGMARRERGGPRRSFASGHARERAHGGRPRGPLRGTRRCRAHARAGAVRALREGPRLPQRAHEAGPQARRVARSRRPSDARRGRHEAGARAGLGSPGGRGLRREELLPDRPGARLPRLPRLSRDGGRAVARRAHGRSVRELRPMPRGVSDARLRGAARARRASLHLVPHDRARGADRRGPASRPRGLGLRLRRLSGRLSLQSHARLRRPRRRPLRRAGASARRRRRSGAAHGRRGLPGVHRGLAVEARRPGRPRTEPRRGPRKQGRKRHLPVLRELEARDPDAAVRDAAAWALARIDARGDDEP